jgi:hypothetical protein
VGYRRSITDRETFAQHAAPVAISIHIRRVNASRDEAADEYEWLMQLYAERMRQIEAGEWPGVERELT